MILSDDSVLDAESHRLREALERHPLFEAIREPRDLRQFMQVHVFAVWDFMSLAKRLQRDLTSVTLPWSPPRDREAARLINEIVLAEESDVGPDGCAASHLDLYLGAMREVGASTDVFEDFLAALGRGMPYDVALHAPGIPNVVRSFVKGTLATAIDGSTLEAMASFFHGRESVIPHMFQGLLDRWGLTAEAAPLFVYYLQRHIQLDGDAHGPAAAKLLNALIQGRMSDRRMASLAAREALEARYRLWDGTLRLIQSTSPESAEVAPLAAQS
jgi:hypothetical protein